MSLRKWTVLLLAPVWIACNKTEPLTPLPQSRILQYKVTNLYDTVIYGSINDSSFTVTVYLPFYLNLQVIDPSLQLSPGASLADSIGPVLVNDSTRYTVKGKDGSVSTYRLQIIVQAQPLVMQELSTANTPAAYAANGYISSLSGNFNTTDLSAFSLSLISVNTGKAYPLGFNSNSYISLQNGVYWLSMISIPADIDSGLYTMRAVLFGQNTAALQYPIRIYYPGPNLLPMANAGVGAVEQGGSFTIKANTASTFRGLTGFSVLAGGVWTPLTIRSYTNTTALLQVPANFPVGVYTDFQLTCTGYPVQTYTNGSRGSLTVLSP